MPSDNYGFYLYTKKRHKKFLVTQKAFEPSTWAKIWRNKTENEQLKLSSQGLLAPSPLQIQLCFYFLSDCVCLAVGELAPSGEESPPPCIYVSLRPANYLKAEQEIQVIAAMRK